MNFIILSYEDGPIRVKETNTLSETGSVSFVADVVMLNISLFEFPLNHPYSKFFLIKLSNIYFLLTSNFIISLSESP